MTQLADHPTRRSLLKAGAAFATASSLYASSQPVRFGLIADIHHGRMPDARARLNRFLDEVSTRDLDFVAQLGDMCDGYTATPTAEQRAFLAAWHSLRAPHYSVLGNHEMDRCDKERVTDWLEMPSKHYSFDCRDFHFVVLDCMNIREDGKYFDYRDGNYFKRNPDDISRVDPEQMEWLTQDLKATRKPTILFTHPCVAPFWDPGAERSRADLRQVVRDLNRSADRPKVIAIFSGHHHVDFYSTEEGAHHFLVNSASYFWVGEKYGSLAKYKDPLFTFVTIDPAGKILIEPSVSAFIPPTPAELGHPAADHVTASISARTVSFRPQRSEIF